MKKTTTASVLVLAVMIALASIAIAQVAKKGWKKTVTLSSGEVILDMSGEWDALYEFYGPHSWIEPITDILTITATPFIDY